MQAHQSAMPASHFKDYEQILALDERQLAHVSVFVEPGHQIVVDFLIVSRFDVQ